MSTSFSLSSIAAATVVENMIAFGLTSFSYLVNFHYKKEQSQFASKKKETRMNTSLSQQVMRDKTRKEHVSTESNPIKEILQ